VSDDYEFIRYESERGRARIVLNRPEKHNALNRQLQVEVHDAYWRADDDPSVHSVIVKGAGPSFCAGYDLKGSGALLTAEERGVHRGSSEFDDDAWQMERSQQYLIAPFDMHKPVIAQVHGNCLAGGNVLAMFCDMIIVADDARIGFPPARDLGALPSNLWLYFVGPQWAKRLMLSGDTITGAEAAQIGWAMKSVPRELLDAEVEQLADRFALIDHHLLSANKRVINLGMELMGARTLQRLAVEIDARAHRAPGTREWFKKVNELPLREAFRQRDAKFGDGRARVNGPEIRDESGRLID